MVMKVLPVDAGWVRAVLALTAEPWGRGPVEAAFRAHGWAPADTALDWDGGSGVPHFFAPGSDGPDPDDDGTGWRFELSADGDRPVVRLPCALFWPAFGDEPDPDDEDDLDEEYSAVWARRPRATAADFRAEYDRLAALVGAELGAPETTDADDMGGRRTVWARGPLAVVLELTDDINSSSHYDVVAVTVGPAELLAPGA
ncbi:hypothetical protein [Longispora urticae]